MFFRKFLKNIRAISPVISVLLMIAIAVVASLVTYAWVMGYMNFTTDKTGKSIEIQSVANVYSADRKDYVTLVYVQNTGNSPITINQQNSVFVNGTDQQILNPDDVAYPIPAKTTVPLVLYCLGEGFNTIKVVTADGTFSQTSQELSPPLAAPT